MPSNRCWLADDFRRDVRRGKDGETNVCDANQTRQLAPAIAGRWLGKKMAHPARISSLCSSRGRTLAITRGRLLISAFRISGFSIFPKASPSRCLRSFLTPSIGTLPPHRWPDSSLSARSTPFHCNFAGYISVPFVPTAANCRDRQRQRCAQRFQRPRCSAYRPRPAIWPRDFVRPRNQHYGARLRLSPKTKQ